MLYNIWRIDVKVYVLHLGDILEVYETKQKANKRKIALNKKIKEYKQINVELSKLDYYDDNGYQEINGVGYDIFW